MVIFQKNSEDQKDFIYLNILKCGVQEFTEAEIYYWDACLSIKCLYFYLVDKSHLETKENSNR